MKIRLIKPLLLLPLLLLLVFPVTGQKTRPFPLFSEEPDIISNYYIYGKENNCAADWKKNNIVLRPVLRNRHLNISTSEMRKLLKNYIERNRQGFIPTLRYSRRIKSYIRTQVFFWDLEYLRLLATLKDRHALINYSDFSVATDLYGKFLFQCDRFLQQKKFRKYLDAPPGDSLTGYWMKNDSSVIVKVIKSTGKYYGTIVTQRIDYENLANGLEFILLPPEQNEGHCIYFDRYPYRVSSVLSINRDTTISYDGSFRALGVGYRVEPGYLSTAFGSFKPIRPDSIDHYKSLFAHKKRFNLERAENELRQVNDSIFYIQLRSFEDSIDLLPDRTTYFPRLEKFKDNIRKSKYLVVNLLDNGGGDVPNLKKLLELTLRDSVAYKNLCNNFYRIADEGYVSLIKKYLDSIPENIDRNAAIDVINNPGKMMRAVVEIDMYSDHSFLLENNQKKILILCNGRSKSASEYFISLLSKQGNSLIIGEPTYGAMKSGSSAKFELPNFDLYIPTSKNSFLYDPVKNGYREKYLVPDIRRIFPEPFLSDEDVTRLVHTYQHTSR